MNIRIIILQFSKNRTVLEEMDFFAGFQSWTWVSSNISKLSEKCIVHVWTQKFEFLFLDVSTYFRPCSRTSYINWKFWHFYGDNDGQENLLTRRSLIVISEKILQNRVESDVRNNIRQSKVCTIQCFVAKKDGLENILWISKDCKFRKNVADR